MAPRRNARKSVATATSPALEISDSEFTAAETYDFLQDAKPTQGRRLTRSRMPSISESAPEPVTKGSRKGRKSAMVPTSPKEDLADRVKKRRSQDNLPPLEKSQDVLPPPSKPPKKATKPRKSVAKAGKGKLSGIKEDLPLLILEESPTKGIMTNSFYESPSKKVKTKIISKAEDKENVLPSPKKSLVNSPTKATSPLKKISKSGNKTMTEEDILKSLEFDAEPLAASPKKLKTVKSQPSKAEKPKPVKKTAAKKSVSVKPGKTSEDEILKSLDLDEEPAASDSKKSKTDKKPPAKKAPAVVAKTVKNLPKRGRASKIPIKSPEKSPKPESKSEVVDSASVPVKPSPVAPIKGSKIPVISPVASLKASLKATLSKSIKLNTPARAKARSVKVKVKKITRSKTPLKSSLAKTPTVKSELAKTPTVKSETPVAATESVVKKSAAVAKVEMTPEVAKPVVEANPKLTGKKIAKSGKKTDVETPKTNKVKAETPAVVEQALKVGNKSEKSSTRQSHGKVIGKAEETPKSSKVKAETPQLVEKSQTVSGKKIEKSAKKVASKVATPVAPASEEKEIMRVEVLNSKLGTGVKRSGNDSGVSLPKNKKLRLDQPSPKPSPKASATPVASKPTPKSVIKPKPKLMSKTPQSSLKPMKKSATPVEGSLKKPLKRLTAKIATPAQVKPSDVLRKNLKKAVEVKRTEKIQQKPNTSPYAMDSEDGSPVLKKVEQENSQKVLTMLTGTPAKPVQRKRKFGTVLQPTPLNLECKSVEMKRSTSRAFSSTPLKSGKVEEQSLAMTPIKSISQGQSELVEVNAVPPSPAPQMVTGSLGKIVSNCVIM